MKRLSIFFAAAIILTSIPLTHAKEIDLRKFWDEKTPLANPHKGWYHHFPDNHINKYIIKDDSDLLDFPGMDHVYIRLSWAYLEPQEGQYNWDVVDSIIDKWTAHDIGYAFRISCKETSTDRIEQQFATPKWVMEADAKGDYYRNGEKTGPEGPWEPVFDDPIFLEKLEHFLKAFAERYDGQPWLRYVDIGSIGDWGEGHTHSGSRLSYGYEARKKHIDLYCKYFKKSQLTISDDFVYAVGGEEDRQKLHQYVLDKGISYRDDSILVSWYIKTYPDDDSVRSPEFFEDSYLKVPNVFELQHYPIVRREGDWFAKPDSTMAKFGKGKTGPDMFKGAVKRLHATYIGYHGDARAFLSENKELAGELLNRCGYWFFPHKIVVPDTIIGRWNSEMQITWENRGAAPAYHPYKLRVRLEGSGQQYGDYDAGNQKWLPVEDKVYTETYNLMVGKPKKKGTFRLKIKMLDLDTGRSVLLPLNESIMDERGYYEVGSVRVE